MPWGVFGRFDKFGLFDPFNDYLAVLLRIVTHFALIGPDSQFAFRVFVMMTIFWAVVTWVIALTVRSFVSPKGGVIAALALCWLPFSNQVFLAQWITYEPRPNVNLPLGHELYRSLFSWSPQFIRNKIGQDLSFGSTAVLWLIPVLLITAWLLLFFSAYTSDRLRAFASLRLMITSLTLPVLLIVGNGWLNTHYLFIPASLFWISTIVLAFSHHARHKNVLRISATVLTLCYCSAISGVYYVL